MTALDVYNIAKSQLPVREQEQLCNMLKNDVQDKCKIKKKKENLFQNLLSKMEYSI